MSILETKMWPYDLMILQNPVQSVAEEKKQPLAMMVDGGLEEDPEAIWEFQVSWRMIPKACQKTWTEKKTKNPLVVLTKSLGWNEYPHSFTIGNTWRLQSVRDFFRDPH